MTFLDLCTAPMYMDASLGRGVHLPYKCSTSAILPPLIEDLPFVSPSVSHYFANFHWLLLLFGFVCCCVVGLLWLFVLFFGFFLENSAFN